jgi:hypothetical protein
MRSARFVDDAAADDVDDDTVAWSSLAPDEAMAEDDDDDDDSLVTNLVGGVLHDAMGLNASIWAGCDHNATNATTNVDDRYMISPLFFLFPPFRVSTSPGRVMCA